MCGCLSLAQSDFVFGDVAVSLCICISLSVCECECVCRCLGMGGFVAVFLFVVGSDLRRGHFMFTRGQDNLFEGAEGGMGWATL